MNAYFYDRKSPTRPQHTGLCQFSVEWLSWAELGGPDKGRIRADGPLPALQELNRMLRSPVRILDEHSIPRWWGYVEEIELHLDGLIYVMTLEGYANRVAVRWSDDGGSPLSSREGYDYQTTWLDSVASQQEGYGVKEMIFDIGEARQAQAEAARLTQLTKRSKPQTRASMGERNARPFAYIRLAGWIHTVGWRFYSHNRGYVGNLEWSGIPHEVGNSGPHTLVGQQFLTAGSSNWEFSELWLRLYRVGSPADNVTVYLYDPPATNILASVTFAGSTLEREATGWKKVVFTPYTLTAGTVYWIVIGRSGGNDGNNYYGVRIEQGVKLGYNFSQWQNGVGWTAEVPNASMVMGVFGQEETTVQLRNVLASAAGGQALTGVQIVQASGIKTRMFRPGKLRAIDELKNMLLTGTSAGAELRATISEARVMVIDTRPSQPASAELYIYPDGEIRHKGGGRLLESPVGKWAKVVGLQDVGGLYNPSSAVYITRAEWDTLGAPAGAGGKLRVKWE